MISLFSYLLLVVVLHWISVAGCRLLTCLLDAWLLLPAWRFDLLLTVGFCGVGV